MPKTRHFLVLVLCAFAADAHAQTAQPRAEDPRTALIVGQVVDATSGKPIANTIVTLTPGAVAVNAIAAFPVAPPGVPGVPRVMTGPDGQFTFRGLPKGVYGVYATKPDHVDGAFGRRSPGGLAQQLVLAEGEKAGDIVVPMWKFAVVSGTVVDEAGEPIVGAQVRMLRRTYVGGRPKFTAIYGFMATMRGAVATDDRGQYRFSGLTPGDYVVGIDAMQGSIPLSLAQASSDPTARSAQLSQIFQVRGPTSLPGASSGALQIGDAVLALPPGGLTPPPPVDGRLAVYPNVYYPNAATVSRATVITIGSGEDRSGVDFQLTPAPTSRVAGSLVGDPDAVGNVQVWLNQLDSQDSSVGIDTVAATITDSSGAFVFPAVPIGQYTLRALKTPASPRSGSTTIIQAGSGVVFSTSIVGSGTPTPVPTEPTMYALAPVAVGHRDLTGITIPLQAGPRVTGRIEFDGSAPKPTPDQLERLTVQLEGVVPGGGTGVPSGHADKTGGFSTYSVPAGKYFVRPSGSLPGWTFRSATYNGRDLSESPLDLEGADVTGVVLTFTDRPADLSGTVRSADGRADADATVLLFPSSPQAWANAGPLRRFRAVRATKTGAFTTSGLPPGSYYAVAVAADAVGEWTDPRTLEALAKVATEVRLDEGDKKTQDLRTKEVR